MRDLNNGHDRASADTDGGQTWVIPPLAGSSVYMGRVTSPSGIIVVLDMGYLDVWLRGALSAAEADRIQSAVRAGGGAACVENEGVPAVVVAGAPTDIPMEVFGVRVGTGQFAECWRWVYLDIRPGGTIDRSERVGNVLVDWARLMFGDLSALGEWRHNDSLDGLADVVFWGRDAEALSREVGAPKHTKGFGWNDVPVAEAKRRWETVIDAQAKSRLRAGIDLRPHSHHYYMMAQVRTTKTGSGTPEVGGAQICGFHTSIGDGWFPVVRDLDRDGRLIRVRIFVGADD